MHMSGITSEEELDDHFELINIPNEWGTNVELAILGALAHLDILVINATNNDHQFWRVDTIYAHNIVPAISLCNPTFNGQRLGIVLHRLHNSDMLYHFDPFYFSSS